MRDIGQGRCPRQPHRHHQRARDDASGARDKRGGIAKKESKPRAKVGERARTKKAAQVSKYLASSTAAAQQHIVTRYMMHDAQACPRHHPSYGIRCCVCASGRCAQPRPEALERAPACAWRVRVRRVAGQQPLCAVWRALALAALAWLFCGFFFFIISICLSIA
jgi:hypothetical protein